MAKSRFEYVKQFEIPDPALMNTYMVVRVDGKGFTRFCECHQLVKPNDVRLLSVMNKAARHVMQEFKDVMMAYGQSDEYSFVFKKSSTLYNRRCSKILSTVCSMFSSAFVYFWPDYFQRNDTTIPDEFELDNAIKELWPREKGSVKLAYPPGFDSRLICYPSKKELRDYFSWRQADCHINNLYNTCFWKLVLEAGISPREANELCGQTNSGGKNELLFSKFNTNYNNIPALVRKGTTIVRLPSLSKRELKRQERKSKKNGDESKDSLPATPAASSDIDDSIKELQGVDIIGEEFWKQYPFITDDDY